MPKLFETIDCLTNENFIDIISKFRTENKMFTNSDCIFIEYHDVLNMPWYILMKLMTQSDKLSEIFTIDKYRYSTDLVLMEAYLNRFSRNFLMDYIKEGSGITSEVCDLILSQFMDNESLYSINIPMAMRTIFSSAISTKCAKSYIVYSDEYSPHIEKDIISTYGKSVIYRHGEFKEVLKDIPKDSTYIMADHNKILTMLEEGRLEYSALLMANGYKYNFSTVDGKTVHNINYDNLLKDTVFKVSFFTPI